MIIGNQETQMLAHPQLATFIYGHALNDSAKKKSKPAILLATSTRTNPCFQCQISRRWHVISKEDLFIYCEKKEDFSCLEVILVKETKILLISADKDWLL